MSIVLRIFIFVFCLVSFSCTGFKLGSSGNSIHAGGIFSNRKHPMNMPDEYILGDQTLNLNGMGLDEIHRPKIYHCGFYSLEAPKLKEDILKTDQPMVLRLVFGRHTYREDLFKLWRTAYGRNVSEEDDAAWELLQAFESAFPGEIERGDRLDLIYEPQKGLRLDMFNEMRARFQDPPDPRLIFQIWLGEKPLDPGLKRNLLWRPPRQ